MRVAEWLTYTDIDQLKRLNAYYQCDCDDHSKHELISSLLQQMVKKSSKKALLDELSDTEHRFLQLMVLDITPKYTMEELVAKGRAALSKSEGDPRKLVAALIKKGWLFKGYSPSTQNLFEIPSDTKQHFIDLIMSPYLEGENSVSTPEFYRDEEHLLLSDLHHFLEYLVKDVVRLSSDGSIYKNQQRILFQGFFVVEEPVKKQGPRFGFGRNYHVYPDRFSLLYDYAFYKGYIFENLEEGILQLTPLGREKLLTKADTEKEEIYRFWIRLYRKPVFHLPVIVQWFGLLAENKWISIETIYKAVQPWISTYYYETIEGLFHRIIQMMLHVGVIKIGTVEDKKILKLTKSGKKWLHRVSAFKEKTIEEGFIRER